METSRRYLLTAAFVLLLIILGTVAYTIVGVIAFMVSAH